MGHLLMASFVVITKNLNNYDSKFSNLMGWQKYHLDCKTFLKSNQTSTITKYAGPTETKKYHLVILCAFIDDNNYYTLV